MLFTNKEIDKKGGEGNGMQSLPDIQFSTPDRSDKGRCKVGMINPKTVKGAREAAEFIGIRYICDKEGMRGKVLAQKK